MPSPLRSGDETHMAESPAAGPDWPTPFREFVDLLGRLLAARWKVAANVLCDSEQSETHDGDEAKTSQASAERRK